MAENTRSHRTPIKVDSALAALAVILFWGGALPLEEFSHAATALKALANTAPFSFLPCLRSLMSKRRG